jgi:hypothetical protein
LLFGSFSLAASADDRCLEIVKTLEQNTLRLKEYATALQNAHRERDFPMVTLLNSEIDDHEPVDQASDSSRCSTKKHTLYQL